jgi:hypothetical protein
MGKACSKCEIDSSLVLSFTYSWGVAKLHYSTAARVYIMRQENSGLGD